MYNNSKRRLVARESWKELWHFPVFLRPETVSALILKAKSITVNLHSSYGILVQFVLLHSDSNSEIHLLEVIAQVRAKWDFSAKDEGDLSFKFGDTINVVEHGKSTSLKWSCGLNFFLALC
jgi:hypothetical protein